MKKAIVLLFIFLTISIGNSYSQEASDNSKKNTFLTFDGLTFINPVHPRFRLGVAQDITENIKLGAELGFGLENMSVVRNFYFDYSQPRDYSLFEVRGQIYYHFAPEKRINQYVSFEVYNVVHKETIYDDYYYDKDADEDTYFDRANFTRNKTGGQMKYGFFTSPDSRIGVNIYGGIGLRVKTNSFNNLKNVNVTTASGAVEFLGSNRKIGSELGMDVSLGLKLFFRL